MYRTNDHPHDHDHWHNRPFRGEDRSRGGFRGPRGFGGPEGRGGAFGQAVFGLISAARAAGHGDETQRARVEVILTDARRAIFAVLAEAGATPATDRPDGGRPDPES